MPARSLQQCTNTPPGERTRLYICDKHGRACVHALPGVTYTCVHVCATSHVRRPGVGSKACMPPWPSSGGNWVAVMWGQLGGGAAAVSVRVHASMDGWMWRGCCWPGGPLAHRQTVTRWWLCACASSGTDKAAHHARAGGELAGQTCAHRARCTPMHQYYAASAAQNEAWVHPHPGCIPASRYNAHATDPPLSLLHCSESDEDFDFPDKSCCAIS